VVVLLAPRLLLNQGFYIFHFLFQAAARAARPTAKNAPLAACVKGRHVTPAAASEAPVTSALCPWDGAM